MLKLILQITGWLLAHTPQILLRAFTRVLGNSLFFILPRRRRLFFANLDHAFPDRPRAWQAKIARESGCRLIETALLSLASPFLSEEQLRGIASAGSSVELLYSQHHEQPLPVVLGTVHFAYWESETWLKLLLAQPMPETGVIFRPLDNKSADQWVKKTRERFGLRLLSRKEGFQDALKILRRKGVIALLFDQNAGMQGALTLLFGRVCSTTELTGLLVEKFGARLYAFYPRRLGFWRIELNAVPIDHGGSSAGATLALNRWLEATLSSDDNLCASWLWSHDRWRHQDMPAKRLHLESKRDLLAADLAARRLVVMPRKTRIFVRMPNWLGDVVMVLPLLRALRVSRPDAELTLIAKASFLPLLESWDIADRFEPLPSRGLGYFLHFWKLRRRYPDAYLLFTHSARGDFEAWLTRCRQRFGVIKRGRRRPLLTHSYRVPTDFDESHHHQLELWENFLRHFGLNAPADRTPIARRPPPQTNPPFPLPDRAVIGFIAGSENNPEKRWPVAHWRRLAENLLSESTTSTLQLFGTANDQPVTAAIADGLDAGRVVDLAGRTDLTAYRAKLRACRLLVTNDTGGMHLANFLGVPAIALFGPTNPVRTGPVFSAPFEILQPPGCPATGGGTLADLAPETVLAAIHRQLASSSS